MTTKQIHTGDVGTIFKVLILDDSTGLAADISAATTKQIIFRKPNRGTLTKTADFTTDGTDGYIQYATITGDLDTAGAWDIQGKVIDANNTNSSEKGSFYVHKNL